MQRKFIGNLVLLVSSLVLTFAAIEAVFRYLQGRKSKISYVAASRSIYQYDQEFGYRYVPNAQATVVTVREGAVAMYDSIKVGPYGNLGNDTKSWVEDDFKIAVFGDSFTSNPTGYHSWTQYISEPLSKAIGKNVSVMNLARDGYGVLSMIHQAAKTIDRLNADLVIIAFIADDLSRDRFWRINVSVNGKERLFVSTEASSNPDFQSVQDYMILDPRVNVSWSSSLIESKSSDELLSTLNESFLVYQDEGLKSGLPRYTSSMFIDRIVHNDPYFTLRKVPRMPRIAQTDFRQIPAIVSDIQSILQQGTPHLFVMLPVYQDFAAGSTQMTSTDRNLLNSLAALFPNGIVNLFDVSEKPVAPFEQYFMLPHDPHPNEVGARWYAKEIIEVIKKGDVVGKQSASLHKK